MFFRWFCKPRLKPLSKQHGSDAMKVINTSRPHCTGSGSWFSSLYHRITVSERLRTLKNNQDKSQQSTVTVIPCVQRNKAMAMGHEAMSLSLRLWALPRYATSNRTSATNHAMHSLWGHDAGWLTYQGPLLQAKSLAHAGVAGAAWVHSPQSKK